jgi:hypothetical protein
MPAAHAPPAPVPRSVSWFTPWRWFASWKPWKRWSLFAVIIFAVYAESFVALGVITYRRHPISIYSPPAHRQAWNTFTAMYVPLTFAMEWIPGLKPVLYFQYHALTDPRRLNDWPDQKKGFYNE